MDDFYIKLGVNLAKDICRVVDVMRPWRNVGFMCVFN